MTKPLQAAIWYARHGWHVLPLRDRDKIPRITDWETEATTDLHTIRNWWRKWPNANVGIAAGKSGLLVLDIDAYKEHYAGSNLIAPADEETITNLTGNDGSHLIYRMPEDAFYGNGTGSLPDGIDIRGWGGQFVAPPSIHPNGNLYRWELNYGPHEIEPLPIPDNLRDLLDSYQARQAELIEFTDAMLEPPDLTQWRLSRRIQDLIHNPPPQGKRSEADQSVITALCLCGATNDEIRAVFDHYPIGANGKYHDKGRTALHYLAHSVSRARAWCEQKREAEIEQRAAELLLMAGR